MTPRAGTRRSTRTEWVEHVAFHRVKYGRELLIDVACIHDIPTFILDRPHTLAFFEIVLVTRGLGTVWLDADEHRVRAGSVVFTSPRQVRRWHVDRLDGVCLLFPALFLEEFFRDDGFVDHLPYFDDAGRTAVLTLPSVAAASVRRRLMAMRRELRRLRPDSVHLLRARLYEVLVMLARAFPVRRDQHKQHDRVQGDRLTRRFRALVRERATLCHTVDAFARDLAVSPGHLNRLSKRHLGRSAKAVIQEALVLEARRRLLYTSDSTAQVGYALGFTDPSYFTRFFRRATGRTPSQFRRDTHVGSGGGARRAVDRPSDERAGRGSPSGDGLLDARLT